MSDYGLTPFRGPVDVDVGMLFMMGGVSIDPGARTTLKNLFAAGEVAGNTHGARRVSGNAFPEMVVFGSIAGRAATAEAAKSRELPPFDSRITEAAREMIDRHTREKSEERSAIELKNEIRAVMRKAAHIWRDAEKLNAGLECLGELEKHISGVKTGGLTARYDTRLIDVLDLRFMCKTSMLVCAAALAREESRGFHFRSDFPEEREEWLKHTMVKISDGKIEVGSKPIRM